MTRGNCPTQGWTCKVFWLSWQKWPHFWLNSLNKSLLSPQYDPTSWSATGNSTNNDQASTKQTLILAFKTRHRGYFQKKCPILQYTTGVFCRGVLVMLKVASRNTTPCWPVYLDSCSSPVSEAFKVELQPIDAFKHSAPLILDYLSTLTCLQLGYYLIWFVRNRS